jgi:uncharacterized protein
MKFFPLRKGILVKQIVSLIAAVVVIGGVCFPQTGDDAPATKEDVERYLEVMHSHELMKKTLQAMSQGMQPMLHEQYLKHKDELPADYEQTMTARMNEMFENMPSDEMMQAMVPVYQKHFTKGDIDNMIAFYSTPTGAKLMNEMPAIMKESMQASTPIMMKYMDTVRAKLQQQTDAMIAQAKKKPDTTPVAH